VVSEKGIECDPDKTAAVDAWPRPTDVSEVHAFCGIAFYYRSFVPNFAHIAKPLHRLTQKNMPFDWTEACEDAFKELKRHISSPPILAAPRNIRQLVLNTSASDVSLVCVLQQEQGNMLPVIGLYYQSRTVWRRVRT